MAKEFANLDFNDLLFNNGDFSFCARKEKNGNNLNKKELKKNKISEHDSNSLKKKEKYSTETKYSIHSVVTNHRPFFHKLMRNSWDAEELEQNLQVKFFEKSLEEQDFLKEVQNLNAFVVVSARFEAINMWKKISRRKNHDSIDNEENSSLINILSDKGSSRSQIEREIDEEPIRKIMLESLENFSKYDQTLIELKLFQGCKPAHIVEILIEEYADLLASEFPEYLNLSIEELKEKLGDFVPRDCNTAESKYRQKLNRELIKRKR